MKSTSQDAVLQKAKNAVKRLRLDCRIDGVQQGWKLELVKVLDQGTIQNVARLAAGAHGDVRGVAGDRRGVVVAATEESTDFEVREVG